MSLNFTEEGIRRLPEPIVVKLQSLIQRVRAITILKGAFATAAWTIGTVIGIMLLYAAVPFLPDWVGYLGSLAVLGVLLYSAWRFLMAPLSRKLNLADIARLVEQRHPELQERISTSVELLASDDPDELKGSEQLIRMVVQEAITDVSAVRPEEEFTRRKAKPFILASAVLVGVLVLSFIIWPKLSPRLFARVVAPYANLGNMYAGMLHVTPGDQVVLKGDSLNIRVDIDRPRVRRSEIRMQRGGAEEIIERMTRSDESDTEQSVFGIYFPSVTDSFTYRVRSMKAESAEYTVTVVEPPAIEALTVTWDFPEYTGLPDITRTNRGENISAPVGTQLSFHAVYNKLVKFSTMMLDKEMVGEGLVERTEGSWQVAVKPRMDASWKIQLEDQYGNQNRAQEFMISAVPDRVPEITIQKPEDTKLRLQPTELLPIDYFVQEDYGLSELELHLDLDGQKEVPKSQTLPKRLEGNNQPLWTGRVFLDLASLDLDGIRQVRAHLLVRDNLPGVFDGPQEGTTRTLVIDIDRTAQSLAEQANEEQKREVEEALRQILERLNRARESSHHAPNWVQENDGLPDWMLEHLKRGHKELSAADAALKQLAQEVVETPYASMGPELSDIAEKNTTIAKNAVELMQLTDIKRERLSHAEELKLQTQIAINRVTELLKEKDALAEKAEELAELTDLAKEEFQLAQEARELAEEQEAEPEASEQALADWQEDQQRLANELGEMLQEDQEALAEQLAQDAETASELAEEANELSELQDTIADLSEQLDDDANPEEDLAQAIQNALQQVQEEIGEDAAEIGEQLAQLSEDAQQASNEAEASENPDAATEPGAEPNSPQTAESEDGVPQDNEQLNEASDALSEAAEHAQQAAEDIGESALDEAIENAGEVREQLQEAQESLNADSSPPSTPESAPGEPSAPEPSSPESPPGESPSGESPSNPEAEQLAEEIEGLMAEQSAVEEALEALQEGNLGEALSALQEAVESQVGELTEEAEAFSAQQEALDNPGAESLAEAGAESTAEASEALAEAGEPAAGEPSSGEPSSGEPSSGEPSSGEPSSGEPSSGEPSTGEPSAGSPPSAPAAAQASESLAEAADAFEQLEGLLSDQAEQMAQTAQPSEALADGSQLSESLGQAAEAASAPSAEAAAQAAQAAAQSMAEMANAAAQSLGMQNAPGLPSNSPGQQGQPAPGQPGQMAQQPGGMQPSELSRSPDIDFVKVPDFLAKMGLTTADWIKMRALGANDVEVSAMADIPEEYRDLVSKYFREVARQSVKK